MSQGQIEKAILGHFNEQHFFDAGCRARRARELAAHLAKELSPTFDAVWNAVTYFGDCQNLDNYLRCNYNGSGSVISSRGTMLKWPASKTPGKSIIEAIKAAMKPEPTLEEKAMVALRKMETLMRTTHSLWEPELKVIRQALEAKGCES